MCGRYTIFQTGELAKRFKLPEGQSERLLSELKATYNASPQQFLPVVVMDNGRKVLEAMDWGFLPVWAKDPAAFRRLINARADSVFEKPIWKGPVRHNRCLVPANGFYEWQATDSKVKTPFYIHPKDQELFGFAGVCSTYLTADGSEWPTFAIVTTEPNREMSAIHNRMPVILKPEDEDRWLDPSLDSPEDLADLLAPYPDGMLEIYEVSRDVNSPRNDEPALIAPKSAQ